MSRPGPGALPQSSDEALVALAAEGDRRAFGLLYDRYAQRIHSWAGHVLGHDRADDAAQEIFLLLWRRAAQFDPDRGSFAAWFMTIARHEIWRELRRTPAQGRLAAAGEIERLLERGGSVEPDPAERAVQRLSLPAIAIALRTMPPEQRHVLVLAYFTGLTQAAIAGQLGIPLGTVKKRVRLGLAKLRSAAIAADEDPPARETTIK